MENAQDKNISQSIPTSASQYDRLIESILGKSFDLKHYKFRTNKDDAVLTYIDGLANTDLIDRDIIRPLRSNSFDGNLVKTINAVMEEVKDIDTLIKGVLDGNAAIYYDNSCKAYLIEFKQWDKRSVEAPDSESVTRGPKEGFTENIQTNTSLLRRKLRTSNLVLESMRLGKQSNTLISLVYLEDIVNKKVLQEVKNRLSKIDVDAILESGQLEQYLEEKPYSLMSGIGLTQKPDIAAGRILEGRVAIMCDGTPHVMTIPELFIETLQTSQDYYSRTLYATFTRILRLIALMFSILLPGLAVAIMTFNPEMMPFVFLRTVISSTKGTPLPIAAEFFFLILMFELLKEAGLRLPKNIGSAITIVGALIIGDAAVTAGVVSAPSVIIIALTAVSGLVIPNLNQFTAIYKLFFLFLGSTMGLIGISSGVIVVLITLISADSFGIPMLSSFSKEELKDSLIRAPLPSSNFRPQSIVKNNVRRKRFEAKGDNDV